MITLPSGHVVTADELAARQTTIAIKTVDESLASNTTLQNDDELFVTVAANTTYKVEAVLIYSGATTGDMKVAFTWPTSATMPWGLLGYTTALAFQAVAFSAPSSGTPFSVGCNGAGNDLVLYLSGTLTVGSTAGTLQIQWAQAASDATATIVRAGSWLSLTPV